MTNETPQTIRAWIDETFPGSSQRARVRRSVKEWLELDAAIERKASREEIVEEAADVAICGIAWASPNDLQPGWVDYGVPHASMPPLKAIEAGSFWKLINSLCWISNGWNNLQSAINAKMAINRARQRDIAADGTGQHRKGNDIATAHAEGRNAGLEEAAIAMWHYCKGECDCTGGCAVEDCAFASSILALKTPAPGASGV